MSLLTLENLPRLILDMLGAFFAILLLSSMLGTRKKISLFNAFNAGIGWLIYLIVESYHGAVVASFIAGVAITSLAIFASIKYKAPVTIAVIPGFYPLVPGIAMYKSIYYYIIGETSKGMSFMRDTLLIALMIALSIIFTQSIFNMARRIKRKLQHTLSMKNT